MRREEPTIAESLGHIRAYLQEIAGFMPGDPEPAGHIVVLATEIRAGLDAVAESVIKLADAVENVAAMLDETPSQEPGRGAP